MQRDPSTRRDYRRVLTLIFRIVAGLVCAAAALLWLLCVAGVLSSRLSSDPADDPHGYRLIFGTMLSLPAALVTGLTLPVALPHRRITVVANAVLLLGTAAALAALVSD
ncbi:hypothetical protein [Nocardia sp. NPDC048505]|uniref:hypothetical protein n=1 Tax=unclassified Nocardia TaxID=2637762 RepID=UPI0033CEC363